MGGDLQWSSGLSLITPIPKREDWPIKGHFFLNAGRLVAFNQSTSAGVSFSLLISCEQSDLHSFRSSSSGKVILGSTARTSGLGWLRYHVQAFYSPCRAELWYANRRAQRRWREKRPSSGIGPSLPLRRDSPIVGLERIVVAGRTAVLRSLAIVAYILHNRIHRIQGSHWSSTLFYSRTCLLD